MAKVISSTISINKNHVRLAFYHMVFVISVEELDTIHISTNIANAINIKYIIE
jgi:hypothetical protein